MQNNADFDIDGKYCWNYPKCARNLANIAHKNAVKNNADFDIEHDDGKYGLNYPKYAQNLVN